MAISFDNSASYGLTGATSYTQSYTVGSGSNRLLLVWLEFNPAATVSSVTYAGSSLTQILSHPFSGYSTQYLYALVAPATGANNLVINVSNKYFWVGAFAGSYAGCAQANPTNFANATASTNPYTTSLTTGSNNSWVGVFAADSFSATLSFNAGTTQRQFVGGMLYGDSNAPVTPAGSFTTSINTGGTGDIVYSTLVEIPPFAVLDYGVSWSHGINQPSGSWINSIVSV